MNMSSFFDRLEQNQKEKYSVEEIREAGEKMIEEMPEENQDAREYMRAAIEVTIKKLKGDK